MISHVVMGIADFERAMQFYRPLMEALGLKVRLTDSAVPWTVWVSPDAPRPLFIIRTPLDGEAANAGNGHLTALLAPDRATVNRCHALALQNGGRDEGAPGLRPHYHPDYWGAYFRDPDGNKLCVVCHTPEPGIRP
jgi:catechol 2,3-dioxygenase-like lactoylglutathione lyase family enzyme